MRQTRQAAAIILLALTTAQLGCSNAEPSSLEDAVASVAQPLGKSTGIITSEGPVLDDGRRGSVGQLPFGPPPSKDPADAHPAPTDPKDYGLCALLSMGGVWDEYSEASISVGEDGYYQYNVLQGIGSPVIFAEFTCIGLSELANLPPPDSAWAHFDQLIFAGKNPPNIVAEDKTESMCLWAGAAGALSEIKTKYSDYEQAFAQYDASGFSVEQIMSEPTVPLRSFAWCIEYKEPYLWSVAQKYYPRKPQYPFLHHAYLNTKSADDAWCYMEGVRAGGIFADGKQFSTAIGVDSKVSPPAYYVENSNAGQFWNCLLRDQ